MRFSSSGDQLSVCVFRADVLVDLLFAVLYLNT